MCCFTMFNYRERQGTFMKILMLSSEAAPFAKSGGLGDVIGALPQALAALGHDVRVVLPKYGAIPEKYVSEMKFLFYVCASWLAQ